MPNLTPEQLSRQRERNRENVRKYRERHPEKIKAYGRKRWLDPEFRKKSVEYHRQWVSKNQDNFKKVQKERNRAYFQKNKESLRGKRREYARRHGETRRKYYLANREKVIAAVLRWTKANPERVRASAHKRRLAKSVGTFTASDVAQIRKIQKSKCYWCDGPLVANYEIDHVIPLARGGTNHRRNIVLSCWTCNRSKHAKMPAQFAGRLF